MTKKRYAELDIAKGIGALLVITGHIQYISEGFRDFIVAFHIPLFFIIAGMLICIQEEDKKSLAKTVMKKCRSILQPYFIFSLIFIVAQYEAYRIGSTITLELVKQNIFLTCIMYGMSVMWFLGALFAGELAFLGVIKICKKWAPVCFVIWLIISCIANRYLQYFCAIHADIPHISYWMYFFQVIIRIGIIVTFIGVGFYLWRLRKKVKVAPWAAGIVGVIALLVTAWISRINGGIIVFCRGNTGKCRHYRYQYVGERFIQISAFWFAGILRQKFPDCHVDTCRYLCDVCFCYFGHALQ